MVVLAINPKFAQVQECNKELVPSLKENSSEEKQLQDGTKVPGMKMDLTVTVFLVQTMAIWLWILEEVVEDTMTRLDVGHVTELGMLLLTVTP